MKTRASSKELQKKDEATARVIEKKAEEVVSGAGKNSATEIFGFYRDHYFDPTYSPEEEANPKNRAGTPAKFPDLLWAMLKQSAEEGHENIVSWCPHGRSFMVRRPSEFVEKIMHR